MSGSPYQLKEDRHSSHSVILSLLGPGGGRRALDVGAADGFLAELLSERGWIVTALERDPFQADRARPRCHEVVVADLADSVPRLEGPFDAIVFGDVLEHLPDPVSVLVALGGQLSRRGRIIVSVPNVAHLWVRLSLLLGRFDYADRGILDRTHLRFFTRRSLLEMLAACGLTVDELRATPVPLPLVVPPHLHGRWLDATHSASAWAARAWPGGLAYQFVASCRPSFVKDPSPEARRGESVAWSRAPRQEGAL